MLRISKLTDYATVIMSYLAREPEAVFSATHIAKKVHLGLPTVSKILKILSETHLVTSFRGTGGGYCLGRSAKKITVAEVVMAVEGHVALTECCHEALNHCALDSLCSVKENWKVINQMILSSLSKITLQDMLGSLKTHSAPFRGIAIEVQG